MNIELSPTQQQAYQQIQETWKLGAVFSVRGHTGMGVSTVLHHLHAEMGGAFLNGKDMIKAMQNRHPLAFEETLEQLILEALRRENVVYVDHFTTFSPALTGYCGSYPRPGFLDAALATLMHYAEDAEKKLVFGLATCAPEEINKRDWSAAVWGLGEDDYAFFGRKWLLSALAEKLDYAKIHRFASHLNVYQWRQIGQWLRHETDMDTDGFIEYLRAQHLASNVDLDEVQAVDLHSLKGVDDIIQALEVNVVLPFENDDLAVQLDLKPKRGILLAGPPGTGKTTIGRALAHRLKSKFFLIDGSFIAGSHDFYRRIQYIFGQAKSNAPSIIFIDDTDVIFEGGEELGLYRYLLSMLDGLESASIGRVCVIMTAMDVAHLPPALLRSGRIELWLETRLPDTAARQEILRERIAILPGMLQAADMHMLALATDGLTGADIKRVVEDAKILYAYDLAQNNGFSAPTDYFLRPVETVRGNKGRYAEAEARARNRREHRPVYFESHGIESHSLESHGTMEADFAVASSR